MRIPRRALLGSIAILSLGGCLDAVGRTTPTPTPHPDSDGDGVPNHADDYPTDDRRAFTSSRSTGSPTLERGAFSAIALTNSPQASGEYLHYEVSTEGDATIDCLVFERDAYDAYQEGARDVPVVSEYSRLDVASASITTQLDRGEYIFALDYTSLATEPEAERVDVEYVVELADPVSTTVE